MKLTAHLINTGKASLVLLFICIGFTVWGQTGDLLALKDQAYEKDLATAKATMKAYESGNWEELRSFLDENATVYGLGHFDSMTVEQSINYWSAGREYAAPILADNGTWLNVSHKEGPQTGDWVYHWGNNTISYQDGNTISFPYHIALKMVDHKITEAHFYYDNNKIIRALGYAIDPPLEEQPDEDIVSIVKQP